MGILDDEYDSAAVFVKNGSDPVGCAVAGVDRVIGHFKVHVLDGADDGRAAFGLFIVVCRCVLIEKA